MKNQFHRAPAAAKLLGIGLSTFYKYQADGSIPTGIQLPDSRVVVWPEYELEQIAAAYISGKTTDEMRILAAQIITNRKEAV